MKRLAILSLLAILAGSAFLSCKSGDKAPDHGTELTFQMRDEMDEYDMVFPVMCSVLEARAKSCSPYATLTYDDEALQVRILLPGFRDQERIARIFSLTGSFRFLEVYPSEDVWNYLGAMVGEDAFLLDRQYGSGPSVGQAGMDDAVHLVLSVMEQQKYGAASDPSWPRYFQLLPSADPDPETGEYALYGVNSDAPYYDARSIGEVKVETGKDGRATLLICVDEESAQDFYQFTMMNLGRYVAFELDGCVYSCPFVNEAVSNGHLMISNMSETEAEDFAIVLRSGSTLTAPDIFFEEITYKEY